MSRFGPLALHVGTGAVAAVMLAFLGCERECYRDYFLVVSACTWALSAIPSILWAFRGIVAARSAAWVLAVGWIPAAAAVAFGVVPIVHDLFA